MPVFKDYSKYYDLLYADKDYSAEVEYIHELIQREFPGAKSILNLGCGTGKHDALLAEKGYTVVAVDMSETMIGIAKENYSHSGNIEFQVGDVRRFRTEKKFDAVISLFHVMSYQITNDDLKDTFDTAAYHMNTDSVFIFDCWHGPGVITEKPESRVKTMADASMEIVRHAEPVLFPQENRVDVHYTIAISDAEKQLVNTIDECHSMRYLFKPELDLVASLSGLRITHDFAWMKDTAPTFASWNAVYTLAKHNPKGYA